MSRQVDGGLALVGTAAGGTTQVTVVLAADGKAVLDTDVEGLEQVYVDGAPVPAVHAAVAAPTTSNGPK